MAVTHDTPTPAGKASAAALTSSPPGPCAQVAECERWVREVKKTMKLLSEHCSGLEKQARLCTGVADQKQKLQQQTSSIARAKAKDDQSSSKQQSKDGGVKGSSFDDDDAITGGLPLGLGDDGNSSKEGPSSKSTFQQLRDRHAALQAAVRQVIADGELGHTAGSTSSNSISSKQ
mmetsp:Transcript_76698/g.167569  ORF Transcript_76698/g.167569 Transcript_76698/m.167569 type:complete len:175 (+) Transcript_76698:69-593(+)